MPADLFLPDTQAALDALRERQRFVECGAPSAEGAGLRADMAPVAGFMIPQVEAFDRRASSEGAKSEASGTVPIERQRSQTTYHWRRHRVSDRVICNGYEKAASRGGCAWVMR